MPTETLTAAGIERMDAEEITGFLASHGSGVLGLVDGSVPYLLPMSFGYDGEECLYFTFVVGEASHKEELAREVGRAAFLVYDAPSAFQWQSVLLTGAIEPLPDDRWDDFASALENAWRPAVFEQVDAADVSVYRFIIEERTGYRHAGLPPGFERDE